MSFKDMAAADREQVFLNVDFFGEMYRIEGKTIPIVLDTDELKVRQGGQDLAVAESATLFYARAEDLPPRRSAGQSLNVNGRECLIDDWKVDMGLATVVLRENITA
nr:sugar ABC transporter ATP-binding protein [uncultured Butyricicoccus sp.]